MHPEIILEICELLHEDLSRETLRCRAIPVVTQVHVCAALSFLATATFHLVVADTDLRISRPSVCRAVDAVTRGLVRHGSLSR